MTTAPLPAPGAQRPWSRLADSAELRTVLGSVGLRLGVGALAVVVAFHYSLLTLMRDLGLDTPLAYLGLVPLIAVGVALYLPRDTSGPDIHDRQLDHIVGLPLVVAAVLAIELLPDRLSTVYWTDRLDLLALPVFVFGVSVLLFGLRSTWRYRAPIAFLFMAWSYPYTLVIERTVDTTTQVTIDGLKGALSVLPFAHQASPTDDSIFTVPHGAGSFPVSIASACAGVNSMIGFVVVGVAFLTIVRRRPGRAARAAAKATGTHAHAVAGGALGRKLAWLGVGLVLVWALNVARLMIVLWAGKTWGETVALDGLHPYIGVVMFALAIVALLLVMPFFGLELLNGTPAPRVATDDHGGTRPAAWRERLAQTPRSGGRWRISALTVVVAAVLVGVTDASFQRYELTASDLGTPRLASFDGGATVVPGYSAAKTNDYDWVKQYFGGSSTWHRYSYQSTGYASSAITADVIDGSNLGKFNAYGIEACYTFHGYSFVDQQRVSLGGGVDGYQLSYTDPRTHGSWDVLYWVWAVKGATGSKRYERVTLLQPRGTVSDPSSLAPQSAPLKGVGSSAPLQGGAVSASGTNAALYAFAQQMVAHQPVAAAKPATGTTTGPAGTSGVPVAPPINGTTT